MEEDEASKEVQLWDLAVGVVVHTIFDILCIKCLCDSMGCKHCTQYECCYERCDVDTCRESCVETCMHNDKHIDDNKN